MLAGDVRDRVSARMVDAYLHGGEQRMQAPYKYYPTKWREPYISRRRKIGWDLYGLLGIGDDKDKMALQHARNFRFFDAPVGLIFTIDRDLELGSWLDYGMFLQNVMLAARIRGLDTLHGVSRLPKSIPTRPRWKCRHSATECCARF